MTAAVRRLRHRLANAPPLFSSQQLVTRTLMPSSEMTLHRGEVQSRLFTGKGYNPFTLDT